MVAHETYLPDVMRQVVERVNTFFYADPDDSFSVRFGNGLYAQVGNDLLKDSKLFLIVWLEQPYDQYPATDNSYLEDTKCNLFIAIPTEANYSQIQREEINYHPRLAPVLNKLVEEIKAEQLFGNPENVVWEKRQFLPYWSGGDQNAPGQPNLWKNNADCIKITGLQLKLMHPEGCTFFTSF